MITSLSLAEIAHVIALATAPAFLLGGVIGFISLLHAQQGRVLDRSRTLHTMDSSALEGVSLTAEISRFRQRSKLLRRAIKLAIGAGVATALLIIVAFVGALVQFNVEILVAGLFVVALAFFVASLVCFGAEVRISLGAADFR